MSRNDRHFRVWGGILRALRWTAYLLFAAILVVAVTIGYNFGAQYYYGCFAAAFPLALAIILRRIERRLAIRAVVEAQWARPRPEEKRRQYDGCRAYLPLVGADDAVDEKSWSDLGFDAIISRIDTCYSGAGRNELYRLLACCLPSTDEALRRDRFIARVQSDPEFRCELLVHLAPLDESGDQDPLALLGDEEALPEGRPTGFYVVMSVAALLSPLVAIFAGPVAGLFCIAGIVIANMWIYYAQSKQISAQLPILRGFYRLVRQAARIAGSRLDDSSFDFHTLRDASAKTAPLRRAVVSVLTGSTAAGASADLVDTIAIYLKVLLLIDLIAYSRLVSGVRRHHDAIRTLYRSVGRLDALQAVASFLTRTPELCRAKLDDTRTIDAEALYHPLVERAVANDIHLGPPGAIVTGTNMAGKSTLLRTIGVNVLLAQTIGCCFANSYRAGRFRVMTSIDKRDDLVHGKSYYYAEAERIFRMTEQVGGSAPMALLIDELLSGTNSLERESASVAVLAFLARKQALTVAATHDVTVARRVSDQYAQFFLTDHATETGLAFDYRLRPGIVATRNAIRLLSLIGYPKDIVDAALTDL